MSHGSCLDACGGRWRAEGVRRWTGLESKALRCALRVSTRAFAEHLGVALRTVAKWEKLGEGTTPRPDTQAILDTALTQSPIAVRERFSAMLADQRRHTLLEASDEYESWAEDIERAIVAVGCQNSGSAINLLNRWLQARAPANLDDRRRYLYARSLVVLGDLRRDQGLLGGPLSARQVYAVSREPFAELGISRPTAQAELLLALLEMTGRLESSVRQYRRLGSDQRLSRRDRARARLWEGRACSKSGDSVYAVQVMSEAARTFEDIEEPEDWSVTHQKIALAYRGSDDLRQALHHMDVARSGGFTDTPLQRVRYGTAHGHILLSDRATREAGLSAVDAAERLAGQYGLGHQLRSIEAIRSSFEKAGRSGRGPRR